MSIHAFSCWTAGVRDNVHWIEVEELGIELATADGREYRAEVEVAFELE